MAEKVMTGDSRATPPPLDLRAVEARLNATDVCYECREDMQALLAHGRALRAALAHTARNEAWQVVKELREVGSCSLGSLDALDEALSKADDRAAAVLAQATDTTSSE